MSSPSSAAEGVGALSQQDLGSTSAVRRHASAVFADLLDRYRAEDGPLDVSFREMVGPIPVNDLTHSMYPYPARLLRQIPRFFLRCDQLTQPDTIVLDPFCGSGTVLVEAQAASMASWGIDSNPFARLLSSVKTTPLDEHSTIAIANTILGRAKALRSGDIPDVVNIDLWYSPAITRALGRLRRAVLEADQPRSVHSFLLVCLAYVADRSSLRDRRIPVPVRHREWKEKRDAQKPASVWELFEAVTQRAAKQVGTLNSTASRLPLVYGSCATAASETFESLPQRLGRPSLVLTSPPYGAAQKYVRSTSLALGWTGLADARQLRELEHVSIGREHIRQQELEELDLEAEQAHQAVQSIAGRDPVRAAIYAHYFRGMDEALAEISRVITPDGTVILVGGSNTVSGDVLETHRLLRSLAERHGLSPVLALRDTIKGRVLLTKRASTARPLAAETIYVFSRAGT